MIYTKDVAYAYSEMLSLQVDISLPFEKPFFINDEWESSNIIFDFGCGNAEYIKRLSLMYPNKKFYAYEIDPEMRKNAKENTKNISNIKILTMDELNKFNQKVDFFIFRLVLLHLSDRNEGYQFISKIGNISCKVLVIDADDEYFLAKPEPKLFFKTLSELRDKSKDRNLMLKVSEELLLYDMKEVFSSRIIINNHFPHAHDKMWKYMYYTAELSLDGKIPNNLKDELVTWYLNKSYIQYGIFGKIYIKES